MFAVTFTPDDLLIGCAPTEHAAAEIASRHAIEHWDPDQDRTLTELADERAETPEWRDTCDALAHWMRDKYTIARIG